MKSLFLSYDYFYNTLKDISEKSEIITEAKGYRKQLQKLQNGILTLF